MTYIEKQKKTMAMLKFKQRQSENNSEQILNALDDLARPVSSAEIKQHIHQKDLEKAKEDAEDADVTSDKISEYISKNSKTMDLRTIQRWLTKFVQSGLVENKYNKYSLSESGKRHLRFREFARSYGLIALNNIMNCY